MDLQKNIRRILKEEYKFQIAFNKLLNILFDGFDDMYYDWSEYNCGMGVCCDPYAVGFVLPNSNYNEYLFKLVDDRYYDDDGDYIEENLNLIDGLPEVCYEFPNIKNPNFNTIVFYGDNVEEIESYWGNKENWEFNLIDLINEKFGCYANKIIYL